MYQNKHKTTGNYLLNLQLGMLLVLGLSELVRSEKVGNMVSQFLPDVLMMIVSAGSLLWFMQASNYLPRLSFSAAWQKAGIAWRCRGDLMHGATMPVRIVFAPQFA